MTAVTALAPDQVYDQIRRSGGLYKRPGMDAHTEWVEGVDLGKRRVLGSTAISSSMLEGVGGRVRDELEPSPKNATESNDSRGSRKPTEDRREVNGALRDPKTGEEYPQAADINTATQEGLQTIDGIGLKLSTLIVANQPFYAINRGVFQVSDLRGIGKAKIRKILEHYEDAEVTPF